MTIIESGPVAVGATAPTPIGVRVFSRDPEAFGVPIGREEAWRFTPVQLLAAFFQRHPAGGAAGGEPKLTATTPDGVTVRTTLAGDPVRGAVLTPGDRASAVALEAAGEGLAVAVANGATPSEPVVVEQAGTGLSDVAVAGHLAVEVGREATATVVLQRSGSVRLSANLEVSVGDNAELTLIDVHDWAADTVHLEAQAFRLGRDARLRVVTVTMGGALVRVTQSVSYAGPGGDAELFGALLAGEGQHLEHRLLVTHDVPNCRSRVLSKAALHETAHTVWVGDVVIAAGGVGTDTYETNRNLVLTDGARADSVPNLEIETGEVAGAGHASATGRFDDEALFYLQSRGISAPEARKLVVQGFLAEIVDRIAVPAVRARVTETVAAEIERVLA
ncbi:MAG TPA: Fe-S cluster assembly protein SufD [Frankiaceae bacterium]